MLSISEFSDMCHINAQTLRFYHAEGLLIPAEVNDRTGYRSYSFDQVETAMLITVLRGTGMSVELVRRALDEPDKASGLLAEHVGEMRRQRQIQDEAIADADVFLGSWPQVRRIQVPEMTVVSRLAAGPTEVGDQYDWARSDEAIALAVRETVEAIEARGITVTGTPWCSWAVETPEQQQRIFSSEGPQWLVSIPVAVGEPGSGAASSLPDDFELQTFRAQEALSIFIPGKNSIAKYGTALSRLIIPLEGEYVDVSRMRRLLHENGIETTVAIRRLDQSDVESA